MNPKQIIPTMVRAMIYNFVFSMFRGKRGVIMMVVLVGLYFALRYFNVIDF